MGTRGKGADQMSSSEASIQSNELKAQNVAVFYPRVQNRTK